MPSALVQHSARLNLVNLDQADGIATLVVRLPVSEEVPVLPPFIIEQIRKRESEDRTRYDQPHLELPLEPIRPPSKQPQEEEKRGVVIVELL